MERSKKSKCTDWIIMTYFMLQLYGLKFYKAETQMARNNDCSSAWINFYDGWMMKIISAGDKKEYVCLKEIEILLVRINFH